MFLKEEEAEEKKGKKKNHPTVQHDHAPFGHRVQIGDHPLKVQAHGLGVKVPVLAALQAGVAKDVEVVAPGRVGHEDLGAPGQKLGDEVGPDPQRPRPGEALDRGAPLLAQGGGTVPQEQPGGGRVEGGEPLDRQVLLVVARGEHPPLGLDDDGEDPGLELLRAVSSDAEVQPLRGGVRAKGLGDAQDGVGRGLGDGVEAGEGVGGRGGGGRHFLQRREPAER